MVWAKRSLCLLLVLSILLTTTITMTLGETKAAEILYGDVTDDGYINNKDFSRLKAYLADDATSMNKEAADTAYDGYLNNKDLSRLKSYLADDAIHMGPEIIPETVTELADGVPSNYALQRNSLIEVNQIGYLADSEKIGIIRYEDNNKTYQGTCYLVNAITNKVVYSADLKFSKTDFNTRANLYYFDFSSVKTAGVYYIQDISGFSYFFRIGAKVYDELTNAMLKGLYYQRCGTALEAQYAGEYDHAICHTSEAIDLQSMFIEPVEINGETYYIRNDNPTTVDVSGGWHDAGDYGRYVEPAKDVIFKLLYASKLYGEGVYSDDRGIPESGNGVDDTLDEAKYELEWMLKMQRPDGAVYEKVSTQAHAAYVMPEFDQGTLYLSPVTREATTSFAGSMAAAYNVYKDIPLYADFAQICLDAAIKAFNYVVEHDMLSDAKFTNFSVKYFDSKDDIQLDTQGNPTNFKTFGISTGAYGDSSSVDEMFWAAAELYAATGEGRYHDYFKTYYEKLSEHSSMNSVTCAGFGTVCYLLNANADTTIQEELIAELKDKMKDDVRAFNRNAYMNSVLNYYWGSNAEATVGASIMMMTDLFAQTDSYDQYIQDNISYVLGRNYISKCYITGFGGNGVMNPHDRPCMADGIAAPKPGMIVGGPAREATEKLDMIGAPLPSIYADISGSYETNEIAIYWQAEMIFVLAYLNAK